MKPVLIFLLINYLAMPSLSQGIDSEEPRPMMYHNLVYHNLSGKVLLFGGVSKHGWVSDISEVWEYNSQHHKWAKIGEYEAISDSSTHAQSPIYDTKSNRIIVFNSKGETWAFHLETNSWENRKPKNSPSPRCGHSMSYDSEFDKVILFGGFGCTNINDPIYSDTWVYDYNSNTWVQMSPSKNPSNRMYAIMAYNSKEDKTILWGGRLIEQLEDNSIWSYSLKDDEWFQIQAAGGPKNAYAYSSMIYLPEKNIIALFGGGKLESAYVGSQMNEFWTFDFIKMKWELVPTKGTPVPVCLHSMIFIPSANEAVLFGGEINGMYSNTMLQGTWVLNLNQYTWKKY
jgi:hypothetical protein